ncbi:MAG: hypothetical protein DI569_10315 [Sphingopyxis macrogoltabida]|uniref:Uncharacterized protein n=1 Tax=Sphingopyxis macrogoltabida TaxID=33050 RepID=A0A2W5KY24_SPHMC|nr:MAG: hypothetical protein DI569_10315 [Sphingopyxis macrogoltabida]
MRGVKMTGHTLHDATAARFEAEGRRSFECGGIKANPYRAGTMAHDRWAKGFMDALADKDAS